MCLRKINYTKETYFTRIKYPGTRMKNREKLLLVTTNRISKAWTLLIAVSRQLFKETKIKVYESVVLP